MQPLKKRKGMAAFFSSTSSRYFLAFLRPIFLIAAAVTHVFLKWTRRSDPEALHDLVLFSASLEYFIPAPYDMNQLSAPHGPNAFMMKFNGSSRSFLDHAMPVP